MDHTSPDFESRSDRFRELIEEQYQSVYRYAYRLSGQRADAEDITQQTFLFAQRKLDQLRDWDRRRSWLFSIARNHFLKTQRPSANRGAASLDAVAEPLEHREPRDSLLEDDLRQCLDGLLEEYREPLILFYFQDFSYKDIADHLDIPLGTVMSRLARGRKAMRDAFTESQQEATG